jgi:cytochrome c556
VSWGNILGKPDGYNPAHHFQDIGDLYGAEYFVAALDRLSQAFMFGDAASHDEIWRRMDEIRALATDSSSSTLAALKTYVDNAVLPLYSQFAQLDARITNVRNELLTADATIGQRITSVQSTLQTNINTVGTQVTNLQSTLQTADTALGNRITAVEQSLATNVDTLTKSIAQVRTDFLAGDATLKARIDSLSNYGDVSTLIDTKIASARTEWQAADGVINTRVTSVNDALTTKINGVDKALGSHMNNYNNPHRTNYDDVGSYSIQRIDYKEADIYIILNSLSSRLNTVENKLA